MELAWHSLASGPLEHPEWHGWMTSMNDAPPAAEEDYIGERKEHILKMCHSDAGIDHNVGHQEEIFNFLILIIKI